MAASWSGSPNSRVPRPVQVNRSAASAVRPASRSYRSSSAVARVAQLELHGHPDRHHVSYSDRTGAAVCAEDTPDQEIAPPETLAVLVHHPAHL